MTTALRPAVLLVLLALSLQASCSSPVDVYATYAPLEREAMPASPSNRFADDADAASLGRALFFDTALSSDGTVSCATCHAPETGWSDRGRISVGVEGRRGPRRAPSVLNAGWSTWAMWDGRKDTLWAQPVGAFENPDEMNLKRTTLIARVAERHGLHYDEVFGALPDLSEMPADVGPGDAAWEALPQARKHALNTVVAQIGKAIEAYERTLVCDDTRFDRFLLGNPSVITQQELRGAETFARVGCTECHSGPLLTDQAFHNIGVGAPSRHLAVGRRDAHAHIAADVFNSTGAHSDDTGWGHAHLDAARRDAGDSAMLGAFKTPGLRGVTQRTHFMRNGTMSTLDDALKFYDADRQDGALGDLAEHARIGLSGGEREDIIAFLHTLACDEALSAPPTEFVDAARSCDSCSTP